MARFNGKRCYSFNKLPESFSASSNGTLIHSDSLNFGFPAAFFWLLECRAKIAQITGFLLLPSLPLTRTVVFPTSYSVAKECAHCLALSLPSMTEYLALIHLYSSRSHRRVILAQALVVRSEAPARRLLCAQPKHSGILHKDAVLSSC